MSHAYIPGNTEMESLQNIVDDSSNLKIREHHSLQALLLCVLHTCVNTIH